MEAYQEGHHGQPGSMGGLQGRHRVSGDSPPRGTRTAAGEGRNPMHSRVGTDALGVQVDILKRESSRPLAWKATGPEDFLRGNMHRCHRR
jgi:hypothetical protein